MRTAGLSRRRVLALVAGAGACLSSLACARWTSPAAPAATPATAATRNPGQHGGSGPAPVLLVGNARSANPFSTYLTEILLAEGLTLFEHTDIEALDVARLSRSTVVVLGEGPLTRDQAQAFGDYIHAGGALIAMRPDERLAAVFGIERTGDGVTDGILTAEPQHPAIATAAPLGLQVRGQADGYRLAGATPLAWLQPDAATAPRLPGITLHQWGQGQAIAWAFDLARSVVYTRQGDPARARFAASGDRPEDFRAVDLFTAWLDLDRLDIPQADELQRLFAHLLRFVGARGGPLPWLWYFPAAAASLVVVTSDAHGIPSAWVDHLLTQVEHHGGRASVYYAPPTLPAGSLRRTASALRAWAGELPLIGSRLRNPAAPPQPPQVAGWRARGHAFGIHPYVEHGVAEGYDRHIHEFAAAGYGPAAPTTRTHRVLWDGWVETARTQASRGVRMSLDHYHCSPALQQRSGAWTHGHLIGSAQPMRFVDERGVVLGVYQQPTQLVDEYLLPMWNDFGPRLDPAAAVLVARDLLRDSRDHGYGPVVVQAHADGFNPAADYHEAVVTWTAGTLASARELALPIWSADAWLAFVEARQAATLSDIAWNAGERQLSVWLTSAAPDAATLGVMLPMEHHGGRLAEAQVDGERATIGQRTITGQTFGWVGVPAGRHQITARYTDQRP